MIVSKVSCFDIKAFYWGCFKGVSSLSDLCLDVNVDYLLYDITGLVGICLLPESDDSSDDVSNESSEWYVTAWLFIKFLVFMWRCYDEAVSRVFLHYQTCV